MAEKKPRKKRAIGYLTKRILDELPFEAKPDESWEMSIDQIKTRLGASKGSVYEVFHVFEALCLVTKVLKSQLIEQSLKLLCFRLAKIPFAGMGFFI